MDKKIIDETYNDMIGIILDNIDSEYHDEVSKNYYNYLCRSFALYKNTQGFIKTEKSFWANKSKEDKLKLLLSDNAFDEISKISNDAFDLALKAYHDGILIPEEDARKYIEVLTSELKKVHEDNKMNAEKLVSEGILDLNYASGSQEITSFRLRDAINANKK